MRIISYNDFCKTYPWVKFEEVKQLGFMFVDFSVFERELTDKPKGGIYLKIETQDGKKWLMRDRELPLKIKKENTND